MNYLFYSWIPIVIALMTTSAFLSTKANNNTYFILLWAISTVPSWAIIAKFTKNLFLDALIYDSIVAITYTCAILYFSNTNISPNIIIGAILCISGIILVALH